jgi:hypothetical protein
MIFIVLYQLRLPDLEKGSKMFKKMKKAALHAQPFNESIGKC